MSDQEKGYVGAVVRVNTAPLEALLKASFIPVVAPVGLNSFYRPADAPAILNFNAHLHGIMLGRIFDGSFLFRLKNKYYWDN